MTTTGPSGRYRRRRWTRRTAALVAVVLVVLLTLRLAGIDRDVVNVVLVVGVVLAAVWLVLDTLAVESPAWTHQHRDALRAADLDDGLVTYTRILEDHLTARDPSPVLRHRLAALADQRLTRHHRTTLGTPEGRELLGPEVTALLSDPEAKRLRLPEVALIVTRIEET